jgi:serine/threonine protein kinase
MSITEGKVGSRNVIGESSSAHARSIRPFTLRDSEDTMSAQTGEPSTLAAFMVRLNNKAVTFQQEYGDQKKSVVHFSRSSPKVDEVPTSSSTTSDGVEVFYGSAPQEHFTPVEAPDMQPHVENSTEYEGSPFEGITFIDEAELEMEEEIAKGGQGHVHLAKWKRDSSVPVPVVVKVMNGNYDLRSLQSLPWWRQLRKVVELGSDENLEGCCRVLGVCVKGTVLWIIMERFAGDLRNFIEQKIRKNSTNWTNSFAATLLTLHMMWSIATGMEILHANGILHRDLKASNILLRGGGTKSSTARFGAKIEQVKEFTGKFERFFSTEKKPGDFESLLKLFEEFQTPPKTSSEPFWFTELSAHLRFVIGDYESSEVDVCGTRFWRAPEVLQALKSGATPVLTEKSDVYSYAMVCYEILTGEIPFETEASSNYDDVLSGKRPQLPAGLDKGLSNLLQRCWLSDPDQRPDFTEIKRFLTSETGHLTTQDWLSLGNPLGKLRIAS